MKNDSEKCYGIMKFQIDTNNAKPELPQFVTFSKENNYTRE